MIVQGAHENQALRNADATIPGAVNDADLPWILVIVVPQLSPRFCIDGEDAVAGRGKVHDSVDHNGGCL